MDKKTMEKLIDSIIFDANEITNVPMTVCKKFISNYVDDRVKTNDYPVIEQSLIEQHLDQYKGYVYQTASLLHFGML